MQMHGGREEIRGGHDGRDKGTMKRIVGVSDEAPVKRRRKARRVGKTRVGNKGVNYCIKNAC